MADEIRLKQQIELLKNRIDDYQQLFETIRLLSSTLDLGQILQKLINEAVQLCFADQGAVVLFVQGKKEIAQTVLNSNDRQGAKLDSYLINLLSGRVYDNNAYLHSHSLVYTFGEELIDEKYQDISSVLALPVISGQEILAVIILVSFNSTNLFDQREIKLMQLLAVQSVNIISNAKRQQTLLQNNGGQSKAPQENDIFEKIITKSDKMQHVFKLLERIMPTAACVLIEGENGTGKERLARLLHDNGPQKTGPFVAVDCAAFPENLLERELFGYVKGAFNGANYDRVGLLEEARNGTLFLDEINTMPSSIQSKLLRALQDAEIHPVSDKESKKIKVRIIAAANEGLKTKIKDSSFREDLYYHLSVVNVKLPSLRERKGDLLLLANHFIKKYSEKYNKQLSGLNNETLTMMEAYTWPGNIRELENVVERMVILAEQGRGYILPELLPDNIRQPAVKSIPAALTSESQETAPIEKKKASLEKDLMVEALEKHNWNQSLAARELGLHESTLRYRMRKFAIRKPTFKSGT